MPVERGPVVCCQLTSVRSSLQQRRTTAWPGKKATGYSLYNWILFSLSVCVKVHHLHGPRGAEMAETQEEPWGPTWSLNRQAGAAPLHHSAPIANWHMVMRTALAEAPAHLLVNIVSKRWPGGVSSRCGGKSTRLPEEGLGRLQWEDCYLRPVKNDWVRRQRDLQYVGGSLEGEPYRQELMGSVGHFAATLDFSWWPSPLVLINASMKFWHANFGRNVQQHH